MSLQNDRLLDRTGREILRLLQTEGRMTWSELGRRVGLSAPAAAERVRRLEDAGIIEGFYAHVPPTRIGLPVTAFVMLTARSKDYPRVLALCENTPQVIECHHVSGEPSFIIKTAVASVAHLESLIARLTRFGETKTLIALSSPVQKRSSLSAMQDAPPPEV